MAPGETLHLHVAAAHHYRVEIYRLGWYDGAGGRRLTCVPGPTCSNDSPAVSAAGAPGAHCWHRLRGRGLDGLVAYEWDSEVAGRGPGVSRVLFAPGGNPASFVTATANSGARVVSWGSMFLTAAAPTPWRRPQRSRARHAS